MRLAGAVRTVAVFEAAKGAVVLLAGAGALSLVHRDVQQFAESLVAHLHLNPAKDAPRIFLNLADKATDSRLWMLAAAAGCYALVRFVEAYGLWKERRWAEWFAAVSGGIYIPFEIEELSRRASWLPAGALALNVAVVALMAYGLLQRGRTPG